MSDDERNETTSILDEEPFDIADTIAQDDAERTATDTKRFEAFRNVLFDDDNGIDPYTVESDPDMGMIRLAVPLPIPDDRTTESLNENIAEQMVSIATLYAKLLDIGYGETHQQSHLLDVTIHEVKHLPDGRTVQGNAAGYYEVPEEWARRFSNGTYTKDEYIQRIIDEKLMAYDDLGGS